MHLGNPYFEENAKFSKEQHMKRVALLASAATLIGSTAFAADLPSRKVAPVAPVAPVFTWTGFYAGINAGGGWGNEKIKSIWYDPSGNRSPEELASFINPPYANNRSGFIGGIQLGYNYQINQFVVGIEADFMGSTIGGSSQSPVLVIFGTIDNVSRTKVQQDWLGTVRVRGGYSIDRLLIFLTGGLAYGNAQVSTTSTDTVDGVVESVWQGGKQSTKFGFTVGAGLEYALTNNWLIRAEYLYYNLGSVSAIATIPVDPLYTQVNTKIDGNIIRAAISYKF